MREYPDGRPKRVSLDGGVMIERDVVASSINIVLNWFEELKRLVPTGRQQ